MYLRIGKNKNKQKNKERESTSKMFKARTEDSGISDDENIRIVCMGPFGKSKSKDMWVKYSHQTSLHSEGYKL